MPDNKFWTVLEEPRVEVDAERSEVWVENPFEEGVEDDGIFGSDPDPI